jgi:hypothetical protein
MSGDKIDARPVRSDHGLPDLVGVELSPGIPGCDVEVQDGLEILVEFVEGDRALPRVVAFAGHDQGIWTPTRVTIDATELKLGSGATKGVARDDDSVEVTIPAGTINVSSPNNSVIVLTGSITSASSKVKAE